MQKIEIVTRERVSVLKITATAGMFQMPKVMGGGFMRIAAFMEAQGCAPKQAPYARYLHVDWDEFANEGKLTAFFKMFSRKFTFEMAFPLECDLDGEGEIELGELPGGRYVQCLHRGPYHKVGKTYEQMQAWMAKEGYRPGAESVEIYMNDPREVAKSDLETVVLIPIEEG